MVRHAWLSLPVLALSIFGALGCTFDDDRWDRHHDDWDDDVYPPPSGGQQPSSPILAEIDTDETLTANPGEGVGIYTEYASGGHWYIWWTCDTRRSGRPCNFDVTVHVESGKMSNVRADKPLATDTVTSTTDGRDTTVRTRTTNNVTGVAFDTEPGAVISLTALVDKVPEPAYLFFVQNGKVNGGYKGRLTNPLRLQGSRP